LVGVATFLLSAVGSTGWEAGLIISMLAFHLFFLKPFRFNKMLEWSPGECTYVALSADHLIAVELGGKSLERWLNDTTTKTENKVESGFL
jgi:hypothetical protein